MALHTTFYIGHVLVIAAAMPHVVDRCSPFKKTIYENNKT